MKRSRRSAITLLAGGALLAAAPAAPAAPKVSKVALPSQIGPGATATAQVTVKNASRKALKPGKVVALLSADARLGGGQRVGAAARPKIKPRKSRTLTVVVRVPNPVPLVSGRVLFCLAPKSGKVTARAVCAGKPITIGGGPAAPTPTPTATPSATPSATASPTASPPPGGIDPAVPLETPDPVNVTQTLTTAAAKRAMIGPAGGTLTVTHTGGGTSTLTVPQGALLGQTLITMTPIESVSGLPFQGGMVMGVDLQPHGLRFVKPATLGFAPPTPVPLAQQTPLNFAEDGKDLHLAPLVGDPAKLEMELMHFSSNVIASGTQAEREALAAKPPANPEAQFEQRAAQAFEKLRNGDGETFAAEMVAISRDYWNKVVRPRLIAAETDETLAGVAIRGYLAWARQLALLGLSDEFEAENTEAISRIDTITKNAYNRAFDRCKAGDFGQVTEMLGIARTRALLGFDGDSSPALQDIGDCVRFEVFVQGDYIRKRDTTYGVETRTYRVRTTLPLEADAEGVLIGTGNWEVLEWSIDDPHPRCPWTPLATEQIRAPSVRVILQLDPVQKVDANGKASTSRTDFARPQLTLDPGQLKHPYETYACASGGWDFGWTSLPHEPYGPRLIPTSPATYLFQGADWTPGTHPVLGLFSLRWQKDDGSTEQDHSTLIEFRHKPK